MDIRELRELKVKEYTEISNNIATCENEINKIHEAMKQLSVDAIKKTGEIQMLDEILAVQAKELAEAGSNEPIAAPAEETVEESPEL